MSIDFHAVAFPILVCASLAAMLLPVKQIVRTIIGCVTALYAVVLLIQHFTASA